MKDIAELFKAEASSPSEIVMLQAGPVGFRIPEYQREYDWSEGNIKRLLGDCLDGFHRLATNPDANPFTFLGTLVLVEEKSKEEEFNAKSVAIIDGQQRLTTLTLIACVLYESLITALNVVDTLPLKQNVKQWIKTETDDRLNDLRACAVGTQYTRGSKSFPFPRIVRANDHRARSETTSEYRSAIARFLFGFAQYTDEDPNEFEIPDLGDGNDAKKLKQNYVIIRRFLKNINDPDWYHDTEYEQVPIAWGKSAGWLRLLDRLADFEKDDSDQNRAKEELRNCQAAHCFLRMLLFAAYFCRYIVLTRVTTESEGAAFDIFDALNTTGEPLTALETLKPRVIQYENSHGNFDGSPSFFAFQQLKENLDEYYKDTAAKQRETKELVVSFALYIEGKKESESLAAQRHFLRTRYDRAAKVSKKNGQRFVSMLADLSQFRRFYWTEPRIQELNGFHSESNLEQVQLFMSVVKSMRTKLALPIFARYWTPDLKNEGDDEFLAVLRAVTAFLIIRRAASGGTAGIDGDLRAIMAQKGGSTRKYGLCAGVETESEPLSVDHLKEALRQLLAEGKFQISERDGWVSQVVENPLYSQSRVVARFLLLAAAHHSMPSTKTRGCWEREHAKVGLHNNLMKYNIWTSNTYKTVEHVAPSTPTGSGWDAEIYESSHLRHSLGNLVLLPKEENSSIGNESWEKKKVFYAALTEKRTTDQTHVIEQSTIPFSKSTKDLLKSGESLFLLEPLSNVDEWNRDVVRRRACNIAELAWDYLRQYLD